MKKSYITLVAIILCVGYGVLSWDIVTHSQEPGTEDSKYAQCNDDKGVSNECCVAFNGALDAVKTDWENNLRKLVDQEIPASAMVDDGYESLRTYNCWVEYICRAVEFSGHAPIESAFGTGEKDQPKGVGTGLKEEHLGIVPGCQAPDNLRMESEYNTFMKTLNEVPIVGATVDAFKDLMTENKINYFPQCMTDTNNASPNIVEARNNYNNCKRTLEEQFGCTAEVAEANKGFCPITSKTSNAFLTLENQLTRSHANQKASALEKKLGTIIPKMHVMETHVGYLSNFLKNLDNRFSCYASKCD